MTPVVPIAERIERNSIPEPMSGCWLWLGALSVRGYGRMKVNRGMRPAHRMSYESVWGPVSDALVIDHKCRQRCCVNPDHLRAVTRTQNVFENSVSLPAINRRKTTCGKGHLLAGDNLMRRNRVGKGPSRQCRTCDRERHHRV